MCDRNKEGRLTSGRREPGAKAVVVLSGGQDSATALAMCVSRHGADRVAAITFGYGQSHALEIKYARALARRFSVSRHKVLRMGFMQDISESALFRRGSRISRRPGAKCPNTVVEGRNAFFLLAASVWAKTLGAGEVWIGVSEADFSGYPDCREGFLRSMERSVRLALDYEVKFVAPFMHRTKAEEWRIAERLGVLDIVEKETLTCYRGVPGRGCGKCPACRLRRRGYEEFLAARQ